MKAIKSTEMCRAASEVTIGAFVAVRFPYIAARIFRAFRYCLSTIDLLIEPVRIV